jgi:glycosyltransferase involved in cell wall biosynthesis
MLILLDCRPLQHLGSDNEKCRLVLSVAAALARDRGVEWLLLVDHTYRPGLFAGLPDMPVLVRRALPGKLGWKLWYDWLIPGIVRKFKCDSVMMTGGVAAAVSKLPQSLWMPVTVDPNEERGDKRALPLYSKRLAASLQHPGAIFCFSEKDRLWLTGKGRVSEEKLVVVHPLVSSTLAPLSGEERERIKGKYTGGREYFFVDAAITASEEEVVRLLRSFSLFKKRQRSNLRLVVSGRWTRQIRERLATYKYKEEVHFFETVDVDEPLMEAAYAVLFPFEHESLGTGMVQAWQTGVPALVRTDGWLREMAGDAVLGVPDADPVSLAIQLMSVYKDESLRAALIEKGFGRVKAFDPRRQVAEVWAAINKRYIV